jgi:hypothetical protein
VKVPEPVRSDLPAPLAIDLPAVASREEAIPPPPVRDHRQGRRHVHRPPLGAFKLYEVLDYDRSPLRLFLEASVWPVRDSFARQAMGHALIRQALLPAQHHSSDAFWRLPSFLSLERIATLDELAEALSRSEPRSRR